MAGRAECRALAEAWRRSGVSAGLIVPSAVVPEAFEKGEFNVVLDAERAELARVVVSASTPLALDRRLLHLVARRTGR